ncbi:hypothetical protein UlMin_046055 [Ulmus minor]
MATHKKPKTLAKTTIITASQPSNSSEIIVNNDELLVQILVKLPLKSLIKFTSVSKHWFSLISGPDFSHRRNPCSVSGIFLESLTYCFPREYDFVDLNQTSDPSNPPFRSLSFINSLSNIRIHHSCNGLLLCSANINREREDYYVYNPTTNKYTTLPPLPLRSWFVWGRSLAFEPRKSPHYKVILVLSGETIDDHYQIEIYSSKTRTWRPSGNSFFCRDTAFAKGVFWNGAVHWICKFEPYLYFNVDEERLSEMPLPPVPDDNDDLRFFLESGSHLHLIHHFFEEKPPCFDIYEMEMDYSNWFLKFRVDLSELFLEKFPHHPGLDDYFFKIVYIDRDDVGDESYAVLRLAEKVIRYNFKSKAFHKLCDSEASKNLCDFESGLSFTAFLIDLVDFHYIESLALV